MDSICQRNSCGGSVVEGVCEDCGKAPIGRASMLAAFAPFVAVGGAGGEGQVDSISHSVRQGSRPLSTPYSRRRSTGAGRIVSMEQPDRDPLDLVLTHAEVPLHKRRCPACEAKVTRLKGYCPQCGEAYEFIPRLAQGDVVQGKLLVKGAIAYGGLGWIYLGRDTLLERWVVLKGLLNGRDSAGAAAAVAERQFLAAVKHPKIVGIYDFVEHAGHGYIVMEYVSGRTLDEIRAGQDRVDLPDAAGSSFKTDTRRSALTRIESSGSHTVSSRGVLPVEEAIGYILAVLPAFSYLHANQLVYCDFKPDNLMLEKGDVKLIDLGGVRRIGDPSGDIYGSRGFTAPEAQEDPVAVSDLFSIGRTLAALVMDFDYQRVHEQDLPTPAEQPILAQHQSLYRFLLKATHRDPTLRFQSADAMAEQLKGLAREIAATHDGPQPAESSIFWGDGLHDSEDTEGTQVVLARLLPMLRVDENDPAAVDLAQFVGTPGTPVSRELPDGLLAKHGGSSLELQLRQIDLQTRLGRHGQSIVTLKQITLDEPLDWRINWYLGKAYLCAARYDLARAEFGKVAFELPGEIAPRLALAFAAEGDGNTELAVQLYQRVARTDPGHASACFGWARCAVAQGDIALAQVALTMVPAAHSMAMRARIVLAGMLMGEGALVDEHRMEQASQVLESVTLDTGLVHQLRARLLSAGFQRMPAGSAPGNTSPRLLGVSGSALSFRLAAEREYRLAADFAKTRGEKAVWIARANGVRPLTLF